MAADESHDDRTQSFVALTSGTTVSHYKIIEKIGAGGMGEVYLAEDTKLNRKVALKFLPAHTASNADVRERFTREAQAVAALSHPNIVTIFEVGEFNDRPFFAMEHVVGDTLGSLIKQRKLSTDESVRLTMQICEGLHKAHESGVVHRDIKPGNIIIDNDGRARILDFGLAIVSGEDKLTKTGSTLGTIGYMSPEQVSGKEVDHRSDLFSVGVILYEMLTGRKPFEGDNDAAIVNAITNSTPDPVARFKSGVTGELQQIVEKSLAKDPSLRYQHADGMLTDLRRLDIGSNRTRKSRSMRTWWTAAAVVTVVAAAVMLGVWMSGDETEAPTSTLRQITYYGDIRLCELSPDGLFYAYSREIGERHHLYVSDFTGGNPVELLACFYIVGFRWSPNGSELVVTYQSDSTAGTYLIPRLGGASRKLVGGSCSNLSATWSPDGDRIALHNACRIFDSITIVQIAPMAVSRIPLSIKGEWSANLDWRKDGHRLLVTSNHSAYNALWTLPPDGQNPVEVLRGDFPAARWSADGRAIYYLEGIESLGGSLAKIAIDKKSGGRSGDPRVLFADLDATRISISDNNEDLLFSRRDVYSNLWYVPIDRTGRGEAKQLTFGTAFACSPAISPDGQSLIYVLHKDNRMDIYQLPLGGGSPQRLTYDGLHNLGPAWSPDGKEIAYSSSTDGNIYYIRTLNLGTGKSHTYTSPTLSFDPAASGLHWGVDDNLYFQKSGNRNILVLNTETGALRELIPNEKEGWIFNPYVSPDGQSVAVDWNNHVKGPGIYLLSLTDSSQVCILEHESEWSLHLGWSTDGEWIYCCDNKHLYRLHRTEGNLDTLGPRPFKIEPEFWAAALPAVTPDGDAFVSVKMDIKTDVWLIENFDPDTD